MNHHLPTLAKIKEHAKSLRAQSASQGVAISHSKALELVARDYGYRDWNALRATIGNKPQECWVPGGRVQGLYMSRPFDATIVAIKKVRPGWFYFELNLDKAVDVVTFDSFSNFRKRIRGTVGPEGTSQERSSNGAPHLQLNI